MVIVVKTATVKTLASNREQLSRFFKRVNDFKDCSDRVACKKFFLGKSSERLQAINGRNLIAAEVASEMRSKSQKWLKTGSGQSRKRWCETIRIANESVIKI